MQSVHVSEGFFDHLRKGKGVVPPTEQMYVLDEPHDGAAARRGRARRPRLPSRLGRRHASARAPRSEQHRVAAAGAAGVPRAAKAAIGQYHKAKHGVFNGENGLHILCVNSREAELCECVELAAAALTSKELGGLFSGQAEGLFFQEPPMDFYGSTVVSYAVAFSLQAALRTMLRCSKQYHAMRGLIDFNDPRRHACRLTGFMPVHVAVANSLT